MVLFVWLSLRQRLSNRKALELENTFNDMLEEKEKCKGGKLWIYII